MPEVQNSTPGVAADGAGRVEKRSGQARVAGVVQVLLSALLFGCMSIFAKLAYQQGVSALTALTFRFAIAALVLWSYVLGFSRGSLRGSPRRLFGLAAFGIVGYGSFSFLLFESLKQTSATQTTLLFYMYPTLVVVMARVVYKEAISRARMLGIGFTILGCALISGAVPWRWQFGPELGLPMAASFVYAVYLVVGQRLLKVIEPRVLVLSINTSLAIVLLAYGGLRTGAVSAAISISGWAAVTAIGLVSCVAPILLFSGIERIGAAKAALLSTVEPLCAVLLAWAFLGEELSWLEALGGCLVIASVILNQERMSHEQPG